MSDFFKELFQTVNERVRNRVFGPFLASFIFWNWKPILLILASNDSIENTIKHLIQNNYFSFWNVFFVPMAISLSYSILLPFVSLLVGKLNMWPVTKTIESGFELKEVRKKGEVKLAHLDFDLENAKAGNLQISELNNKIQTLENSNETYVQDNKKLRESNTVFEKNIVELRSENERNKILYVNYVYDFLSMRYSDQEQLNLLNALKLLQRGDVDLENVKDDIKNDLATFNIIEFRNEIGTNVRACFLTEFGQLFVSHVITYIA